MNPHRTKYAFAAGFSLLVGALGLHAKAPVKLVVAMVVIGVVIPLVAAALDWKNVRRLAKMDVDAKFAGLLLGTVIAAYVLFLIPMVPLVVALTAVLMGVAWWLVITRWPLQPPQGPGVRTYRNQ